MPEQIVYIYYDSVGNNVLSKGIVNQNSGGQLRRTPNNILLIKDAPNVGTYDHSTGFRIIKGQEAVTQFLKSGIDQPSKLGSWIDYSSADMLSQLTPVEISELLYIGHAHNYLHSPFYYKLQNNYIYLSLPNNFTKVYYRHLDEFIDQFSAAITNRMQGKVNEKRRLFQKERIIAPFKIENQERLIPIFREGVCFSFRQMTIKEGLYQVPIFIVEDRLSTIDRPFEDDEIAGTLTYDTNTEQWEVTYNYD